MTRKTIGIAASALLLTSVPTPTYAFSSSTLHLSAHVPVYCNVDITPSAGLSAESGVVTLGAAHETCNAPRGYRVILSHPADLIGVSVLRDTVSIPLSSDGETVISISDHANIASHELALDFGDGPVDLDHLGLRIEVNY